MFGSSQWMYSSGAASFYDHQIDGSLRFNASDSAYLSRTPSAGNRQTWTFSAWMKLGNFDNWPQSEGYIFSVASGSDNTNNFYFKQLDSGQLRVSAYSVNWRATTARFRDPSAWYHVVLACDSTQATAQNRIRLYINGEEVTAWDINNAPSQNQNFAINMAAEHRINQHPPGYNYPWGGYMAEVNFVDGSQLAPTSFGETKSGVWIPKAYSGSYGTNGFHLEFAGNANDSSGNGNNWTANNLSSYDYVPDSPTNNFATLNAALPDSPFNTDRLSQGNLFYNEGEGNNGDGRPTATMGPKEGKWYWEVQVPSQQNSRAIGFTRTDNIGKGNVTLHGSGFTAANSVVGIDLSDDTIDQVNKSGTHTQHASGLTGMANNDIFGISVDLDGGTFQMYRNGSTYGSSYSLSDLSDWQANGMTPTASGNSYMAYRFNFGQDSTFAGNTAAGGNSDANGYGDFKYSVPSGYLALCTANLTVAEAVDPAEDNSPQDYFNTVLYTGDGVNGRSVTGVGFQPDFTWLKVRNAAGRNVLGDSVRGDNAALFSDVTDAETTSGSRIITRISDGFTVSDGGNSNQSGETYVAWNWKANGSGSSNTVGSITSTVSANTGSGFSIVTYTGTGSNATVGHGLDSAPEMVIIKNRNDTQNWMVGSDYLTAWTHILQLNNNVAESSSTNKFNSTAPTSSVFSIGTGVAVNGSSDGIIAYCFHSVEGFSKFGSYEGNLSNDGPFVYTGFRPALVVVKDIDDAKDWRVHDDKRGPYNAIQTLLEWNTSDAEGTGTDRIDFVSNGFKIRNNSNAWNNTHTYIYIAFAENPFKYANAR